MNNRLENFSPEFMEFDSKKMLKESFKNLGSKNISDLELDSEEVKREYIKYHYLILNYLYFDKNDLDFSTKLLDNSLKNTITHSRESVLSLLSDKRKQNLIEASSLSKRTSINQKLLSLPLFYMWEYFDKNIDNLKLGNHTQIDFAEFFGLSHMQDIKTIAEILGFNDLLSWSTINLPLNKFKGLKQELETMEKSGVMGSINGNSLLLTIASSLQVENFENLYYGARSLGYDSKMGLKNVKMPTWRMLTIMEYTKTRYGKPNQDISGENVLNFILTESAIQKIYEDNISLFFNGEKPTDLKASQIAQIKSNIRSALRGFGYRLEIDNNK